MTDDSALGRDITGAIRKIRVKYYDHQTILGPIAHNWGE